MGKNEEVDKHISNTLRLVSDGVKKFGVKKFNKTLISVIVSNEFENDNFIEKIDTIIKYVLHEFRAFNITKEEIFETKKRGDITVARKMAVILIKSNIDISDKKLAGYFGGRCRQVVYNILDEYRNMDIENKLDAEFIEKYSRLDEKIKKFFSTLKTPTEK
jgi:chromosomal replication initiation ATPase DnaA